MKIILPNYNLVQDTKKSGDRTYHYNGNKYPSVTTVIGKYEDKSWLWAWKKKLGSEAKTVTQNASRLGTRVHSLNEKILKREQIDFTSYSTEEVNRHKLFYPFLERLQPALLEEKVYWEGNIKSDKTGQDVLCRYAGTPDLVAFLNNPLNCFSTQIVEDNKPLLFLGDYKNWSKSKQPQDLLKAYLQLSAYIAAVNLLTNGKHKLQDGFILGSTPRKLHIFYLDSTKVKWYWYWFKQILLAYYDPGNHSFDWNEFKAASVGYYANPDYVDEIETPEMSKWLYEDKNYLAEKISLV